MKFELHQQDAQSFVSTRHQGYIVISYDELVSTFGEPNCKGDGEKVDAEWCLKFEDGTLATIYKYNPGQNDMQWGRKSVMKEREWSIGGVTKRAVELVRAAVEGTCSIQLKHTAAKETAPPATSDTADAERYRYIVKAFIEDGGACESIVCIMASTKAQFDKELDEIKEDHDGQK